MGKFVYLSKQVVAIYYFAHNFALIGFVSAANLLEDLLLDEVAHSTFHLSRTFFQRRLAILFGLEIAFQGQEPENLSFLEDKRRAHLHYRVLQILLPFLLFKSFKARGQLGEPTNACFQKLVNTRQLL